MDPRKNPQNVRGPFRARTKKCNDRVNMGPRLALQFTFGWVASFEHYGHSS